MPNQPGTPPNTSIVLTEDELTYIEREWGGSKSAAIHAALRRMSNSTWEADWQWACTILARRGGSVPPSDEEEQWAVGTLCRQIVEERPEQAGDDDGAALCDWIAMGEWDIEFTIADTIAQLDELANS